MKSVTLIGVDGSEWPLTSVDHAGVFLKAEPTNLEPGNIGEPIEGSLDLVIADHSPFMGELHSISVTERLWRNAWSMREYSTLVVMDDDGPGAYYLKLRLAAPIPDFPEFDPDGYVDFTQSVVSESDVWQQMVSSDESTVNVVNSGDVDVWVSVEWSQAGTLVMPSTAAIVLPAVSSPRSMHLDPEESCIVTDSDGAIDYGLWRSLRGKVFPEPVTPGETRKFGVPEGAKLIYHVGVYSPW